MHVYFDLDLTLIDDEGKTLRPGMRELLCSLAMNQVQLSLWTASTRERTLGILNQFNLSKFFNNIICREDYDPYNVGLPKVISYLDGDMLVDDDPKHIEYVRSIGKQGVLISAYFESQPSNETELERLHATILPDVKFSITPQNRRRKSSLFQFFREIKTKIGSSMSP